MELLVIKIVDGKPIDNPILFSNLKNFFPNADYENLPEGYMKFIENPMPDIGVYQIYVKSFLLIDNDVVRTQHIIRDMTQEEKNEKIAEAKAQQKPFPSWIWSEDLCQYTSPVPAPTEDFRQRKKLDPYLKIRWNEDIKDWETHY